LGRDEEIRRFFLLPFRLIVDIEGWDAEEPPSSFQFCKHISLVIRRCGMSELGYDFAAVAFAKTKEPCRI